MASALEEEPNSGDFMVLDSTSKPYGAGQLDLNEEGLIRQRDEAIFKLCSICGEDDDGRNLRPFRIVVIGKHGAGKSSFINGVAAALSEDRWHEHAYTGDLGRGAPITIVNQRHVKCCNEERERYRNVLLPTIIDVAGLSDEADEKLEELLRLLFYGHIEEDEPLMKVYEEMRDYEKSQKSIKEEIRNQYHQSYPEMRVDRVIFVASAEDSLPERLMTCVHRAGRPSHHRTERRAVPIYGVLTKIDKVDVHSTTFLEKKKTFMQGLGLNQSRFIQCSNYCDDLDPHGLRTEKLRPELDVPVLRFMHQMVNKMMVMLGDSAEMTNFCCFHALDLPPFPFMEKVCDRALKVVKENEALPVSAVRTREAMQNAANAERQGAHRGNDIADTWHNLDPIYQDALTSIAVGVLTLLMIYLLVPPTGNPALSEACQKNAFRDQAYRDLLCTRSSSWDQFKQWVGQLVVATLIAGLVFSYRHVNRRL